MKNKEDHYEHVSICADNLLIASKDPQSIISNLSTKHNFKLKGTGPISYHLGCNFGRDEDGALHFTPRKHIEKMKECYLNMFGCKPKLNCMAPLEKEIIRS